MQGARLVEVAPLCIIQELERGCSTKEQNPRKNIFKTTQRLQT